MANLLSSLSKTIHASLGLAILLFLTLFYLNIGFGASPFNSIAKSFLMPGWGEMDFGYKKSSNFFIKSELLINFFLILRK